MRGVVKFYNARKRYGFITSDAGEDIFFHRSGVKNAGFRANLVQGDPVEFQVLEEGEDKRAFQIVRVTGEM